MIATSFNESNHVLDKPPDMSYDECDPLCVWVGNNPAGIPMVISCWKLTANELALINQTGKVWLTILGRTMPPSALSVQSPFSPAGT
jgi:hypothetical protein